MGDVNSLYECMRAEARVLILGRTSWHYDGGRRATAARPPQSRWCARVSDRVAGRAMPDFSKASPSGEGISQMEAFLASAKLTRRPGLAEARGTWPHAALRVENLATYSRSRCHRCCARLATRRWPISRMLPMQSSCSSGSGMSSAGGCVATLQRPSRTAHREARGLIRHHVPATRRHVISNVSFSSQPVRRSVGAQLALFRSHTRTPCKIHTV